ncbi:MAG: hypothetical protein WC516_05855 [Patescibacteria group bacterium]|jgi:hypothetical protein
MNLYENRQKITKEFGQIRKLQNDLFRLSRVSIQKSTDAFLKQINKVEIDTTPIYYDLYQFDGVTYAVGDGGSPAPASAYTATLISGSTYSYTFKYSIWAFPVLSGETPESITDGATPWTYQTTIAIVKKVINFAKMPDWAIDGSRLVCYMYNLDGSLVGNLEFILLEGGDNTQQMSVDFSYFYRWVKQIKGYDFEFYAIYPVDTGHNLTLSANLYFYNPKNYHENKSNKL